MAKLAFFSSTKANKDTYSGRSISKKIKKFNTDNLEDSQKKFSVTTNSQLEWHEKDFEDDNEFMQSNKFQGKINNHNENDSVRLSGSKAESLSVEETNKLRLSLGLKPLEINSTNDQNSSTSNPDVHVPAVNMSQLSQDKKFAEKLETIKEKRNLYQKFNVVQSLGEFTDETIDDTQTWVNKMRNQQSLNHLKLPIQSKQPEPLKKKYKSKDLVGLAIEHNINELKEEGETILTLKDSGILDTDEDILQNINLIDERKANENVENKKNKPDYNPYDDINEENGDIKNNQILSKYNEETDKTRNLYRLDDTGGLLNIQQKSTYNSRKNPLNNSVVQSLNTSALKMAVDFYEESEFKFKKSTLNKRHKSDLKNQHNQTEKMTVNNHEDKGNPIKDHLDNDQSLLECDLPTVELQKVLESCRKNIVKPMAIDNIISKINEINRNLSSYENGSIILDSTMEFCRTVGDSTNLKQINCDTFNNRLNTSSNILIDGNISKKRDQSLDDHNSIVKNDYIQDNSTSKDDDYDNILNEPIISSGLVSAFKLAAHKGYIDIDPEARKQILLKKQQAEQNSNIPLVKHIVDEERTTTFVMNDRSSSLIDRKDGGTSRASSFNFNKSSKLDIKLEYVDDTGKLMDSKEAFRYMSHRFHGKGPGKKKLNNKLIRNKEAKNYEHNILSGDTPLKTVKLMKKKQQENKSAFIVLSGTNPFPSLTKK